MAQQFCAKEKYLLTNTLNCVPVILEGYSVLIDLQNEISVAGRIESADGYMNIKLTDAVLIDRNNQQYPYDNITIRERKIKQIHIPNNVDIQGELQNWIENGFLKYRPRKPRPMKPTFKQIRAEKRHKEALEEILKFKENKTKD